MTLWLPLLLIVLVCVLILYGCYRAFDRLQTRIEQTHGTTRWMALSAAAGVCVIALCTFWACFAFSAGLLQSLGLNLR